MTSHFSVSLFALVLAGTVLLASPAYANGNNCLFQSKGLSMDLGQSLDPSSNIDVIIPLSPAYLVGDCAPGQTMTISGDNGLNYNGTRNLKNGNGDLIPYNLGLPFNKPGPGNNKYVPFPFNGSILGRAYANASAGSYSDQVIISVTP